MLLPVARFLMLGHAQLHVGGLDLEETVDALAERARLAESPEPVGHALRETDLHPAHAFNAAAERQMPILAEHASGLEYGDHRRGTGEDGREGWRREVELRLRHHLARDVAPAEVGRNGSPDHEVGTISGCELTGHRLRDRDGKGRRVERAKGAVDLRERSAYSGYQPRHG
jgi:hypothetical protein